MFRFVLAVSVLLPSLAWAQTPADLARLMGPLQAPAAISSSPAHAFAAQGGGTAIDLARLANSAGSINRAPAAGSASAGVFAGADLARLTGRYGGGPVDDWMVADRGR